MCLHTSDKIRSAKINAGAVPFEYYANSQYEKALLNTKEGTSGPDDYVFCNLKGEM